jgi:hypothetical protein
MFVVIVTLVVVIRVVTITLVAVTVVVVMIPMAFMQLPALLIVIVVRMVPASGHPPVMTPVRSPVSFHQAKTGPGAALRSS